MLVELKRQDQDSQQVELYAIFSVTGAAEWWKQNSRRFDHLQEESARRELDEACRTMRPHDPEGQTTIKISGNAADVIARFLR